MSKSANQSRAEYTHRAWLLRRLSRQPSIAVTDIQSTDRLGRFGVACHHWSRCDSIAKQALLNDGHAHVRSAALLASIAAA